MLMLDAAKKESYMKRIEAIIRPAKLQRSAPLFESLDGAR